MNGCMRTESGRKLLPRTLIRNVFRALFRELLGEPCLRILELRLENRFSEDPYKILCESPEKFCRELRTILGEGLNSLFKVAAEKIIDEYPIDHRHAEKFLKSVKNGDLCGDEFLELLAAAAEKTIRKIAPGALVLRERERNGVIKLIELAEAGGGIEERMSGSLSWAIKIGKVIVFGIELADENIPVAMYSRRYARFRQLADEWIRESSKLLRSILYSYFGDHSSQPI